MARLVAVSAAVLAAAIGASPASASVTAGASIVSSKVRVTYMLSTPAVSQVRVIFTSTSDSTQKWVLGLSSNGGSTASSLSVLIDPNDPTAACTPSGGTVCATDVLSTPRDSLIPTGTYYVEVRYEDSAGWSSSTPSSISLVNLQIPGLPSIASPTPTSGIGANALTLRYTVPLSQSSAPHLIFRSTDAGACSGSLVDLRLNTVSSATEVSASVAYANPGLASTVVASGSGTFVRGCTYTMTFLYDPSLSRVPVALSVSGIRIPTAPSPITGITAMALTFGAQVTWDQVDSGGLPVLPGTTWVRFVPLDGGNFNFMWVLADGARSMRTSGSLPSGRYRVRVHSSNAVGEVLTDGPVITVPALAAEPTGASALLDPVTGDVAVSWTPGFDNYSAITDYAVWVTPAGSPGDDTVGCTAVAPATSCTVRGLPRGGDFVFAVVAVNGEGVSPLSLPTSAVTITRQIATPMGVTAIAGDGSATVSWFHPDDVGGTYTVTASPGGAQCFVAVSAGVSAVLDGHRASCAFSGLDNGTSYTFSVVAPAQGASGASIAAVSDAVVPRGVPSAPGTPTATFDGNTVTVQWPAPGSENGGAIIDYEATASGGAGSCSARASERACSISGLTYGAAVSFTVTARNAAGRGTSSTASVPITPVAAPGAPNSVTVAPGGDANSLVVHWGAADANGSPVTGYVATAVPSGRTCSAGAGSASCTITGVISGTSYTVQVRASNAVGAGALSEAAAPATAASPVAAPVAPPTSVSGSAPATSSASSSSAGGGGGASVSARGSGKAVASTVRVAGPGTVTQVAMITGGGSGRACTAKATAKAAATVALTCSLSSGARAKLRTAPLTLTLTTTFKPKSGRATTVTTVVKLPRSR